MRQLRSLLLLLAVASSQGLAQRPPASPAYVLQGGKVFTLVGLPLEEATVLIRDGKIEAVGRDVEAPPDARVIDASGLEVYPGLIDAVSRLGLTEIRSVSATADVSELGEYSPQLVAAAAVHPASELIPVARANGLSHAVAAPQGGPGSVIAGQASLLHLAGWTVEEMLIAPAVGMMLNWPSLETRRFDRLTFSVTERPFRTVKEEYDETLGELRDWFDAARHYAQAVAESSPPRFERDLKLEALARVVGGQLPVIVVANRKREIQDALEFFGEQGVELILAGGRDAWKVRDLLQEREVPVILGRTQSLPAEEDEPYDQPFRTPGELHAAGLKIAFATFDAAHSHTLPYEAAQAVPYGLPWEEALKAVTLYPAQILGVADRLGTIEPGKLANLIVTDGDPLDIQTKVRYLFINGQLTSTDNKHRHLYETYRARP